MLSFTLSWSALIQTALLVFFAATARARVVPANFGGRLKSRGVQGRQIVTIQLTS